MLPMDFKNFVQIVDMITVLIFMFIAFLFGGILEVSCVKINHLLVPEIASSTDAPVILDCDYSLEFPKDEELVVKWFFNERVYPVYQWIPDGRPQELGILRERLDLNYRASEDRYKIHRALKITKLSPEMSGNFTCSVSTFSSEDSQTKKMLVLVPQESLELKYPPFLNRSAQEASKIVCYAENVFPKPELRLFLNGSEIENSTISYQERNNGLFDIELIADAKDLVDGTEILCELRILQANYTVRKEAIFYQDWSPSSSGHRPNRSQQFRIVFAFLFLRFLFEL